MKKALNYSLLFYAILLVALYLIGSNIIAQANTTMEDPLTFFVLSIVAGFIFNIVLFELGHILGAKLGGYGVYSVSFLGLNISKIEGKWKIGYDGSYDGFTGETKIIAKKDKTNLMLYCWMGSLFVLLEMVIFVCLPSILQVSPYIQYGGYILATIGGIILLYNIMPVRLDSINDAAIMKYVGKNNIDNFNRICEVRYNLYQGLPLENVDALDEVDYITGKLNYYAYLEKMYKGEYGAAEAIIDNLISQSDKISEDVFVELLPAKLAILILTKSKEEVEQYYSDMSAADRKILNTCNSVEGCRNYFAFVSLVIDDFNDAQNILKKYNSKKNKLKEKGRLFDEETLMSIFSNKINELHPEWDFNKEE